MGFSGSLFNEEGTLKSLKMVLMNSLANALKSINNAEKRGKRQVCLRPCSSVIVSLTGRINKVGVIMPRFDIGVRDYEKWANNLLPSRQFGKIVVTTSGGIMDHDEARRKHLGGKIVGFFF